MNLHFRLNDCDGRSTKSAYDANVVLLVTTER